MCKSLFLSTRGVTSTSRVAAPLLCFGSPPEPCHLEVMIELKLREPEWKESAKEKKLKREVEAEARRGGGREKREKVLGGWRLVLKGCRANMDADVFLPSKVLKLVGTSVTYDLGRGRTRDCEHERTLCFYSREPERQLRCSCRPSVKYCTTITSVTVEEEDANNTFWVWIRIACRLIIRDARVILEFRPALVRAQVLRSAGALGLDAYLPWGRSFESGIWKCGRRRSSDGEDTTTGRNVHCSVLQFFSSLNGLKRETLYLVLRTWGFFEDHVVSTVIAYSGVFKMSHAFQHHLSRNSLSHIWNHLVETIQKECNLYHWN